MPIKDEAPTRFADEFRIISPWAHFIALLGFTAMVVVMAISTPKGEHPPPKAVMALLGVVLGVIVASYILVIGYISRDAGRRNMSRLLWTLVAILVPNALGIVLYFILRKPRVANCPQCSAEIEPGYGFCPQCQHRLAPVCPQCQRSLTAGGKFCPYCGADASTAVKA